MYIKKTYMQTTLEFSIPSELDKNNLVQKEADEIERLRNRASFIDVVGHFFWMFVGIKFFGIFFGGRG